MQYVILGVLMLAVAVGVGQLLLRLDTKTLVKVVRYALAAILITAGTLMLMARQIGLGIPAIAFGLAALFRGRIGRFDLGGGSKSAGQASTVRGDFIEATLDHDTGRLSGMVRAGRFAGRSLDDLDETDLHALRHEASFDPDSLALVEAYCDHRFPEWRESREEDDTAGGARDSSAMTAEAAYELLGLPPNAGEAEIRAAHRRLLKGVHPDQGGSTFLAARVNQARDVLLRKRRQG